MSTGYDFVPLAPSVDRTDRGVGSLSGVLTFTLHTLQPLHVGQGIKRVIGETIVRETARASGKLIVPGSTVKGALRSRFEAITRSCMVVAPKRKGWVRSRSRPDVESAEFALTHTIGVLDHCNRSKPCPACALFGCMSLRSRLVVSDLALSKPSSPVLCDVPQQFEPRLHHIGTASVRSKDDRLFFALTSLHGRKLAQEPGLRDKNTKFQKIEAIPADAELRGQIYFQQVREDELGGLLAAMGARPQSSLKLGGGKCYGFGGVRVRPPVAMLRGAPAASDDIFLSACATAFRERLATQHLAKLIDIHRDV